MSTLLQLSDELLLKILSHLDAADLSAVQCACVRLQRLSGDRSLWSIADFSSRRYSCSGLARLLTPDLAPTHTLSLRGLRNTPGKGNKLRLITPHTIRRMAESAPLLRHLAIRETVICSKQITIETLSALSQLRSLSIINCEFINKHNAMNDGSWFRKVHKWLPHLECLQISGTSFIDDYDIMALSKSTKLRKLILSNCIRVGIAMPYLAMAFQFGLNNIEYLDLRGTSLQNSDVLSIIHSGQLTELYLGPMGQVRRHIGTAENVHNLIMPDPRREEPPHQQVLVVNMGPDGPNWRHVRDEELDGLGLNWVREQNEQRKRLREQHEDEHYFIGENGNLLQRRPQLKDQEGASSSGSGSSSSSSSSQKKRKDTLQHDCPPSKKRRVDGREECDDKTAFSSGEDGDDEEDVLPSGSVVRDSLHIGCLHQLDQDFKPDDSLTDLMVPTLISKGTKLRKLHLAGCAISNQGLELLLLHLPGLEEINVMFTLVTQTKIEMYRKAFTHCIISDARPPETPPGACTIFCVC